MLKGLKITSVVIYLGFFHSECLGLKKLEFSLGYLGLVRLSYLGLFRFILTFVTSKT